MDYAAQLLRVAGSLALVLAVFLAVIYGLKRSGRFVRKTQAQPSMEVLSKHSFGPRHHLVLVRIEGRQNVLVGISPQNMSILPTAADPSSAQDAPMKVENL
jgi:flagellar biogenesis protein FliO